MEAPISAANAFYIQSTAAADGASLAEIVLNIGFTPPIPTWGDVADQIRQAEKLQEVEVQPVARIALSPQRALELFGILGSIADQLRPK